MIPLPDNAPPQLAWIVWSVVAVVALVVAVWRLFRWLLDRIDERFKAAIRGPEFQKVVDDRVAAAFQGAVAPLLAMAGDIRRAQDAAAKAHERLDDHLAEHGKAVAS